MDPEALPASLNDLPSLWKLALELNPSLREAEAEIEAARGRLIQATKYPNPRITYSEEELGTSQAAAGAIVVQVQQEIVTGRKRRLEQAAAGRGLGAASLALIARRFEVLTRIRRAYYDYLGWRSTMQVNTQIVATLQAGANVTRELVEKAKSRPRQDLLRIEALLQEARINLDRSRLNEQATWQQLAAEIGLPPPTPPAADSSASEPLIPSWTQDAVMRRVLSVNAELRQAALTREKARLEMERARAEAIPNITVGAGYSRNFAEREAGAVVSLETPLPFWDRKQGLIHEARAHWFKAQAAERITATRLQRETADAWARFQGAQEQVKRLQQEVLPRLEDSLDLITKGYYKAGAPQITFADVLLAEQALNESRLKLAETRRELWRSLADLQGLMHLDVGEEACP
jgi:cobalt-zinc-cadmium efflux system outer membrane protein